METENKNSQDRNRADMPVFHEYSNNKPLLPFISITSALDGKRIRIGSIHREYNNESQRAVYTSFDALGNPIFTDIPDLVSIKKAFVNQREELALAVRKDLAPQKEAVSVEKENREADLAKSRHQKKDKEQSKEKDQSIER